jgi:hypothetical protein
MQKKQIETLIYKLLFFFLKKERFEINYLHFQWIWKNFLNKKKKYSKISIYSFFVNSEIINPSNYGMFARVEPWKDAYFQLKFLVFLSHCCNHFPLLDKDFIESYISNMLSLPTHMFDDSKYKIEFEKLKNNYKWTHKTIFTT